MSNKTTGDQIAANTVADGNLTTTGVVAGTYGSATKSAQVTVTASGRVSAVTEVPISAVATTIISPPQITTDQNNYHPTGLAAEVVLLLDSDAQWDVTGLFALAEGSVVWILYIGTESLSLPNDSTSSSAANRFAFDTDFTLQPNEGIQLQYLNTRWRTYTPNLLTVNSQVTVDVNTSLIGSTTELNFKAGGGITISGNQSSPSAPVAVTISNAGMVLTKTANYTVGVTDGKILGDTSGGGFTLTLPPAANVLVGQPFTFKKISSDGNNLVIDGDSSETIDGATTYTITPQWASITIFSDGTAWFIM